MRYEEEIIEGNTFVLDSGEFILMASNEKLKIPNGIVGIVCGQSSIARVANRTGRAYRCRFRRNNYFRNV